MEDFDSFLLDHAACERKASATAMTFVAHYPDRSELVGEMIRLAQEELEHFRQTHAWIAARGLVLAPDRRDVYVCAMRALGRRGTEPYFLDRLLVAGIIEARGAERFGIVADSLPTGELRDFYDELRGSEARHHGLFVRLGRTYFDEIVVRERLDALLDEEATIVGELPLRAALH
jgi:tRNA-(ms[2]io[6]A)-hydroxylase